MTHASIISHDSAFLCTQCPLKSYSALGDYVTVCLCSCNCMFVFTNLYLSLPSLLFYHQLLLRVRRVLRDGKVYMFVLTDIYQSFSPNPCCGQLIITLNLERFVSLYSLISTYLSLCNPCSPRINDIINLQRLFSLCTLNSLPIPLNPCLLTPAAEVIVI